MRSLPSVILLSVITVSGGGQLAAQPPTGSHLAPDENNCATCHGEVDLWEGETLRLFISQEYLTDDVHFRNGVNCHDCHGGDPSTFDVPAAHATEVGESSSAIAPFRSPLSEVRKACIKCHEHQERGLADGVHGKAVVKRENDRQPQEGAFTCATCHGEIKHRLLSGTDPRSPLFPGNEVQRCGGCHEDARDAYLKSVHGHGLEQSGLLVSAVCSSCHGAHGIYPAKDERSKLHVTNVTHTCAKCHRFIEERLEKSVHGGGDKPGDGAGEPAPAGKAKRKPGCTDCHQGHDLPQPSSVEFRRRLPDRCGDCHTELSHRYALSVHGELTELGYGPAANCSDCHGDHETLAVSDPASRLSPENRQQTCRICHAQAGGNFLNFDPHADHTNAARDPVLYWVYTALMTLIFTVFGFFGLHCALWFVRSLVDVLRSGRPRGLVPGAIAYVRFSSFHRRAHTLMLISFVGLALTGLPLKYSHYDWAKTLAYSLGGFASTGLWHRIFAVSTFACAAAYIVKLLANFRSGRGRSVRRMDLLFGPDSVLPTFRDFADFFKMLRWFVGLGPKPTFERWTYWEKFDFWGAFADIVIIGATGLILWFPGLFCRFLPGKALNIANVIHSTQALLATGFVFAIHFFNTHLRAEKFPADMSVMTGLVSEEEFRDERPEYMDRLRREGKLQQRQVMVPARGKLWLIKTGGVVGLAIGLALLVGILAAALGK